jgi:putative DNA primase/helicase
MKLINYIVPTLNTPLTKGHVDADQLQDKIQNFSGSEGYYCLFDLEPRDTFKQYQGCLQPALGYYVFDFDSSSDVELARLDCLTTIQKLGLESGTYKIFFSGSKGFHLYVRQEFFPLTPSQTVAKDFERIALEIAKAHSLGTLDDSIYQANRKMRIPNSRHPKTGLYKVELTLDQLEALPLDDIRTLAKQPHPTSLASYVTPTTKYAKGSVRPSGSVALKPSDYGLTVSTESNVFASFKEKPCIAALETTKHKEGARHETALALISEYFHRGEPRASTEEKLQAFCEIQGISDRYERDYLRAISDAYSGKAAYSYGCYSKIKQKFCSNSCKLYTKLDPSKRAMVPTASPESLNLVSTDGSGGLPQGDAPLFPDTGARGRILSTHANFEALLNFLGITIEYNVIKKDVSIYIPNTTWLIDTEKNNKLTWLTGQANKYGLPSHQVPEYVALTAMNNTVNPVARWIESNPWDGVSRLDAFYGTVTGADDSDPVARSFKETLMRKWMLSAIAAAYEPSGVSAHGVLVFSGAQNMGKTHWFKRLVPSHLKLSKDGLMLDPKDKDLVYQAVTNWMVELGEVDATFRKADIAQLKAFITKDTDLIRLPYHREASEFARRTVFFASVNESSYLSDHTGNRRFWTIETVAIKADHGLDMQQVWAELLVAYKRGDSWYLDHKEIERLSSHNEKYEAEDPFESKVMEFFSAPNDSDESVVYTCTEILDTLGYKFPTQRDTRAVSRAIQKVFKASLTQVRDGNKRKKGFKLIKINQDNVKDQIC